MHTSTGPWYKHFWPWVVFGLPALSVTAGITTVFIAQHNPDSMVVDDYYKRGLAINQDLARDRMAADLSVRATLRIADGELRLHLASTQSLDESQLILRLVHPTHSDRDRQFVLEHREPAVYAVRMPEVEPALWYVQLQPAHGAWRLNGRWRLPDARELEMLRDAG